MNITFISSFVIGLILSVLVGYVVIYTLNPIPFAIAALLGFLTVISNGKIMTKLTEGPSLAYYCMILTLTLFFSVDEFKTDKNMLLLLMVNILICVAVLFTHSFISLVLFVFLNFYIVLDVIFFYINKQSQ